MNHLTAPMLALLAVAVIMANLPFITSRWFALLPVKTKTLRHHLSEWLVYFVLTGALAYALEKSQGQVQPQGWEFYVTVLAVFAVFAFPGFVLRYFWKSRHH